MASPFRLLGDYNEEFGVLSPFDSCCLDTVRSSFEALHSSVKPLNAFLQWMKCAGSSLRPEEPLCSLTGAIKVFQPLANTSVPLHKLSLDLRWPSAVVVLHQVLYPL